jgi:hypothetical protein
LRLHIHIKDARLKHPPHVEAARAALNAEERAAGNKLKEIRAKLISQLSGGQEGPMGLTPETVKQHPEHVAAKTAHENAFQALRRFNTQYKP